MAYTNAIFYIDLYNGSDTTRASLTTCIASNPTGTVTRITKTGHGLVTGAVVTLSLFTTWLNGVWKITKFDDDSFDLDDAIWTTTADNNGTVVPFGGSSWADAWLTITNGATAARVQPGDVIRVSKTPDPVSIGNATWTFNNRTITLSVTGQTIVVEQCEALWSGATNVTASRDTTNFKEGTSSALLAIAAAFTTGKIAYKQTSVLDLSEFQLLSFWLKNNLTIANGTTLKVCLCSDTIGDVIIDTFYVPNIPATSPFFFLPLAISRVGGGNLGNNINSIALYADSDPGTININLDCFIACKTNGINLQSLISKNGQASGGTEGYYCIKNIVDNTLMIDSTTNSAPSVASNYMGTTETVETYLRESFKTTLGTSTLGAISTINDSGTNVNILEYDFGYEINTTNKNGETFLDGLNCVGYGIYATSKNYVKLSNVAVFRYTMGFLFTASNYFNLTNISNATSCNSTGHSSSSNCSQFTFTNVLNSNNNGIYGFNFNHNLSTMNNISAFGNNTNTSSQGISFTTSTGNRLYNIKSIGNYVGLSTSSSFNNIINDITISNSVNGIAFTSLYDIYIENSSFSGNTTAVRMSGPGACKLRNVIFQSNSSDYVIQFPGIGYEIYSYKHNGVDGDNRYYFYGGNEIWQTSIAHSTEIGAWAFTVNSTRIETFPLTKSIGEVGIEQSGSTATFKVWIKKTAPMNVKLYVKTDVATGVQYTQTLKANDTDWEEIYISFSTTVNYAVVPVYLDVWNSDTIDGNVYMGNKSLVIS